MLARLARASRTLSPTGCVLAAGAIGVAPASLSATAFVWSEALATVVLPGDRHPDAQFYDDPRLDAPGALRCDGGARVHRPTGGCCRSCACSPLLLLRCVMARGMASVGAAIIAVAVGRAAVVSASLTSIYYAVWGRPGRATPRAPDLEATPARERQPAVGARPGLVPAARHARSVGDRRRRVVREQRPPTPQARPDVVIRDARLLIFPHAPLDPRVDRVHVGPHPDRSPDLRPLQRRGHVAGDAVAIAWLVRLRYTAHRFARQRC